MKVSNTTSTIDAIARANTALILLATTIFETVEDYPVNIDPESLELKVVVPWSTAGYGIYGLRASEATLLRRIILERVKNKVTCLVDYNPDTKTWYLNDVYGCAEDALRDLQNNPISAREWLLHQQDWRASECKRRRDFRANSDKTTRKSHTNHA